MNLKFVLFITFLGIINLPRALVEASKGLDAIKKHFNYALSHLSANQMDNINHLKAEISDAIGIEFDYPFIVIPDEILAKSIAKFLQQKKGLYSDESSDENGLTKFRNDFNTLITSTCETIKLDYLVTSTVYKLEAKSNEKFVEVIRGDPNLLNWIQNSGRIVQRCYSLQAEGGYLKVDNLAMFNLGEHNVPTHVGEWFFRPVF